MTEYWYQRKTKLCISIGFPMQLYGNDDFQCVSTAYNLTAYWTDMQKRLD